MSERSTFSPFWHRVRQLRPRLRPHVQITRQHYRGRRWHVVHDPSSNGFFRLSPVGHEFVGLFDGTRTVEEIWRLGLTRHGDEALTQNEVLQLLSQLYQSNLLAGDIAPETEQFLRRGRERKAKKLRSQAIGIMYFKVRLFNPDRILAWIEPILRPLIGKIGLGLWFILMIAAIAALVPEWEALVTGFDSAIAPSNWPAIMAMFVLAKLVHETGHGVITKRFGGQVPEFGAMMLVLVPAPYVDASAAWGFGSKWRRMAVGAGGMIFELALASVAAFIWLNAANESLVKQLAYNLMLTASISTVLFNANPLMRFDGYYILSDLLEIPNLQQRSFSMLKYLAQKHLYRVKNPIPPTGSVSEAWILVVYGIAAAAYRIFLFFSITLFVMGKLFAIGLLLAIWTAAMWFVMPVGSFVHWLASSPLLADFRPRAIATSLALIALIVVSVGVIPAPDRRRAVGIVESMERSGVYAGTDGFVIEAKKRPGDHVEAGETIAVLESPYLTAQLRLSRAQLLEARSREVQATSRDAAEAQVARQYIAMLERQVANLEDRERRLHITAPHAGVIVGNDPQLMVGALLREGTPVCEVVDDEHLRVTATLTQTEASWLFGLSPEAYEVEMKLASSRHETVTARTQRIIAAGRRELPHAALGYGGGGGIETDMQDQTGLTAKTPLFEGHFLALAADGEASSTALPGEPGERVYLRFSLPDKPLLAQWTDRLEKLLQGRAKL